MLTGLFKNASFGPPPNLHKCISLVEVYRFGQCLGWRFSPKSTFVFLISSRACRDAPHSRFRCGDPHQCLPNFLNMLRLALPKIYRGVFHLWKSIDLDSAQSRRDRATRSVILTNFGSIPRNLGDISESQGL